MTTENKKDPFALESGIPGVPSIADPLRPTPKFADRISKRVLGVAFAVLVVVVGLFLLALDQMENKKTAKPTVVASDKPNTATVEAKLPPELGGVTEASKDKPMESATLPQPVAAGSALGDALNPPAKNAGEKHQEKKGGAVVPALDSEIPKDQSAMSPVVVPALTPEQQEAKLEKTARQQRTNQAKSSGMQAKSFNTAAGAVPDGGVPPALSDIFAAAKTAIASAGGGANQAGAPAQGDGEQDAKLTFVKNASKEDRGYHSHVPLQALSQNEIKTGSFIPMTLETSINSGLPGLISARVTEDVYDSITGCRMLIPAMAKVVGRYDSKISLGQGRMLVVWNAMIFPDGSELNLAAMQGYDTSGQSGLESDVDNHYWRLFGLTFGMSMITTGVQLSVPQPNPGLNGTSAQQSTSQVVATALAQQYGALGAQILGKYMAVQPTLRNFAGERFVIMVPRTMVLPKVWRNRCSGNKTN